MDKVGPVGVGGWVGGYLKLNLGVDSSASHFAAARQIATGFTKINALGAGFYDQVSISPRYAKWIISVGPSGAEEGSFTRLHSHRRQGRSQHTQAWRRGQCCC